MISNRILQTTVDGLKAISRVDLCIVDADKNVAAKTFDNVSECLADAISFIDSPAESTRSTCEPLALTSASIRFI